MKGGLTVWDEAVQRHVDVSKPKMATGVILNILDSVELELGGRGSVGIVVTQPGGYNGTAAVEVSQDGGATWLSVRFEDLAPLDPAVSVLDSITSTVMAAGVAYLSVRPVGGATHVRVSEWVGSGGAALTVVITATYGPGREYPRRLYGYGAENDSVLTYPSLTMARGAVTTSEAAYAAGDVIGGEIQVVSAPVSQAVLVLRSLVLTDDKNQKPALQVLFFRVDPTGPFTDNAAVAISTTDLNNLVAMVEIAAADWKNIGGTTKAIVMKEVDVLLMPQSTPLWMVLVVGTGSAPDYAAGATDLRYNVGFQRGAV